MSISQMYCRTGFYVIREASHISLPFMISNKWYESDSINNQPDKFLTGRHSQDFHSVFDNDNKTCVQNLDIFWFSEISLTCLLRIYQ